MKRFISIFLSIICIVGLVGCGNKKGDVTTTSQQNNSVEKNQVDEKQNVSKNEISTNTQDADSKSKEAASENNTSSKNKEITSKNNTSSKSKEITSKNNTSSKSKGASKNISNVNNLNVSIITKDFNQVSSMEITYNNSKSTYSINKNKDFIKKVYDTILSTKVTVNKGHQESDPQFTINLIYKSGDKNVIQSTETGEFIFRVLDNKTGYIGGHNTNLLKIIKANK